MSPPIFRPLMAGSLLLALTTPAFAATLSLQQALQLAEQHSPVLAAAQANMQSAEAAVDTAAAFPNPEIELMSGQVRPRVTGQGTTSINTATLSQPIELPGVRSNRQKMAQAGVGAGKAQLLQTRHLLTSRIKLAFYDALRWEEARRVVAENRELLQQMRNRVKVKVDVGEAPRYELIKAEAEAMAADNSLKSTELRLQQARSLLRSLIGKPLPQDLKLQPDNTSPAAPPALEQIQQELLERHPQVQLAEAETRRAMARVEMERSLRLPQPTLKLNQERTEEARQWMVGVALPLPLWNRRAGPIGEAVAGLHQAEAQAQQARLSLITELEQAYSRYEIASSQVQTFESGLLREAEAALKVAEAAYRFGERSILDYIDAQRVLRTTQLEFLNARYELQAALTELERLRATPASGEQS